MVLHEYSEAVALLWMLVLFLIYYITLSVIFKCYLAQEETSMLSQ